MSQFYGTMIGKAKTEATREGTKNSGLRAHIAGWNSGVRVLAFDDDGHDCFRVYVTGGSNGASPETLLLEIAHTDQGISIESNPDPR
jgi:hypothetical protein